MKQRPPVYKGLNSIKKSIHLVAILLILHDYSDDIWRLECYNHVQEAYKLLQCSIITSGHTRIRLLLVHLFIHILYFI